MERHQLKRIMIVILATLNGFLGLYLVRQRLSEQSAAYRAEQELLALFAADGVAIAPETIPHGQPPPVIELSLDNESPAHLAALLLGSDAEFSKSGTVRQYTLGQAVLQCNDGGEFSAVGLSLRTDPDAFCRAFCRNWSYIPASEDGETVTLSARYGGFTVFNCDVSFSFDGDTLREASGTLIPQNGIIGESPELSAVGALAIFQAKRRENRVVSAEIRRVSLCYALQSTDAGTLTLVPAWHIETDTVPYYVNCVTGSLIFS